MSAQQSGEEGPVVEEHVVGGLAGVSGAAPGKDYREKSASTVVRVLTVFAYLFSVSFAAILLSVYYICIWRSPELIEAQGQASARRADDFRPTFTGDNVTFNFTEFIANSFTLLIKVAVGREEARACAALSHVTPGHRPRLSPAVTIFATNNGSTSAKLTLFANCYTPRALDANNHLRRNNIRRCEVSNCRHERDPSPRAEVGHIDKCGLVTRWDDRVLHFEGDMSSKSYASGSMRSGGGSVRLGAASGHEVVLDALYERKRDKKSVRVLTVIIYVFCVSLAAIMLSLYYVFFWEPKDAHYAQRKVLKTVQAPSTTPLPTCFTLTGRSNTEVNESIAEPTIENIQSAIPINATDLLPSSEDWLFNSTAITMQDNSTSYEMEEPLHITNVT
ncbi:unnamed protein product [Leptosia nina]|uniref:Transmembrane protein INAFM2 n=1 Tax=Leptosia nina TaxID=320188 RepID=A0AAV1JMB6_9NEOP